ncbi:hypothetical protein [Curtobacterium luteum]|uniref:hypothetical protein n=1 Tax=Curtobacterium luteum TaxID=33881 RepID=UPI00381E1DB8
MIDTETVEGDNRTTRTKNSRDHPASLRATNPDGRSATGRRFACCAILRVCATG